MRVLEFWRNKSPSRPLSQEYYGRVVYQKICRLTSLRCQANSRSEARAIFKKLLSENLTTYDEGEAVHCSTNLGSSHCVQSSLGNQSKGLLYGGAGCCKTRLKVDYSELEVKQRLDRLANSAKETISSLPDQSPRDCALAICKVMRDDGIIAARDIDYYATENSFIHLSLQGRGGLPITLAIIFTAIAGRCELPAAPINYARKLWGFC